MTSFFGRESELAQLRAKLEETSVGRGGLVLVSGEPGIGKTRLAEVISDEARLAGWTVVWGRCHQGEQDAPYSPFCESLLELVRGSDQDVLRRCLGYGAAPLSRLAPVLRQILPEIKDPVPLDPGEERLRLFDAFAQFLIAFSEESPILLVLGDLHWADKGTTALLRHVARFAGRSRLLLLGTFRDADVSNEHPLSDALKELQQRGANAHVRLTGLTAEDVGRLVTALSETPVPPRVVKLLHEETSGNPFFARQVMLHLLESGEVLWGDDTWGLTPDRLARLGATDDVRSVVLNRVARLGAQAGRLLSAACAFQGAFILGIAALVAGLSDGEAVCAVEDALGAQLVRCENNDDRYEFEHALVRQALYQEVSPSRRVRLHRSIAERLEQTPDPTRYAGEIAYQYGLSKALPGAERGLSYALAAADHAEGANAFEQAAAFVGIALGLLATSDARRPRLAARRALALANAREYAESAAVAKEAARLLAAAEGSHAAADLLAQVTQAIAGGGDRETTWSLTDAGLRYAGERRDTTWALLARYDLDRREAEDPDNPGIPMDSWERHEITRIFLNSNTDRVPGLAYQSRQQLLDFRHAPAGSTVSLAGDYRRAMRMYQANVRRFEEEGRLSELTLSYAGLSRCMTALGHLEQAESAYSKAAELNKRLPEGANQDLQHLAALWELRLVRGPDSPASLAQLQALLGQASAQHHFASAALRAAAAASAAALGQTDEALAWLETVIDPIERAPAWATNYTALVGMSAWALWFMQRTDHVEVIERNLVSKTLAADFRYPMHDPRHCMARLSALQGRYADASGWFAQARSVTEGQGARPLRAIIDYDEGLMYFRRRRKGDRGRAALLLQAATRQFDAIGMTGWAARADKLQQEILEGSGGQPVLPGALTPREFEVLRLVAQGRTNSEIAAELSLSFRTVGRHITHIFSKLGARNRADATAYATRNGLL